MFKLKDKVFSHCLALSPFSARFYYEATLLKHMKNVGWYCLTEISRDAPENDFAWIIMLQNLNAEHSKGLHGYKVAH